MKQAVNPIKVLIADDHEVLRVGFCSIIKKYPHVQVVAEAANGIQAIEYTDRFLPDVILMDIKMPLMDGIDATGLIIKKHPKIGVIAFSMFDSDQLIGDMITAGARGYLLKNANKEEFVDAIEAVNDQQSYFCNDISIKLVKIIAESRFSKADEDKKVEFKAREKQVIDLMCRQFVTKEISKVMNLSERTIEGYRESIMRKINARNSIGIVIYAIANKLYDPANPDNIKTDAAS